LNPSAFERTRSDRRQRPASIEGPAAIEASLAPGTAPWSRDDRAAQLEAVLFLAREPINSRKLAQFAGLADHWFAG